LEGKVSALVIRLSERLTSVEALRQEWQLARDDYHQAVMNLNRRREYTVERLEAAAERRDQAWRAYWEATRGY
jgi:hypothetical protein